MYEGENSTGAGAREDQGVPVEHGKVIIRLWPFATDQEVPSVGGDCHRSCLRELARNVFNLIWDKSRSSWWTMIDIEQEDITTHRGSLDRFLLMIYEYSTVLLPYTGLQRR